MQIRINTTTSTKSSNTAGLLLLFGALFDQMSQVVCFMTIKQVPWEGAFAIFQNTFVCQAYIKSLFRDAVSFELGHYDST